MRTNTAVVWKCFKAIRAFLLSRRWWSVFDSTGLRPLKFSSESFRTVRDGHCIYPKKNILYKTLFNQEKFDQNSNVVFFLTCIIPVTFLSLRCHFVAISKFASQKCIVTLSFSRTCCMSVCVSIRLNS